MTVEVPAAEREGRRRRAGVLACLLASQLASAAVFAAEARDPELAKEVAREAVELYRAGDPARAAMRFVEAYELSGHPTQLRNGAKAYEAAGMLDDALKLWERYRSHDGVSREEMAEAEAHIGLIQEKKRADAALEAAEAARRAAEEATQDAEAARLEAERARADAARAAVVAEPRGRSNLVGYIGIGTGGALAAASAIVWVLQSTRLADLDERLAMRDSSGKIVNITSGEVQSEVNTINNQRTLSGVLLGVGVAAAAGGVAWMLWGGDGAEPASTLSVAPSGEGASVVWSGRW